MKISGKFLLVLLSVVLCVQTCVVFASAENKTFGFAIDSVNGIRWENYICIYRNVETTNQNRYGCNILVNSDNVVIEKIPAGDQRGENLALPEGGYVVSGIGAKGNLMYNSVNVGDNVFFDEYGMKVLFSSGEIEPFIEFEMKVTGFNTVRGENTVIIYNKSGQRTGTNSYGCEAVVNSDGCIISVGGNNNIVPENGFVVSVIGSENLNNMLVNFTVGAKCELNGKKIEVTYGEAELKTTAKCELDLIKSELEKAKSQYRLIDYSAVETAVNSIDCESISNVKERNSVIEQIKAIKPMLIEQKNVETRSVWHNPTERTAEDIKAVISNAKEAKLNEFIIYLTSPLGTLVPIPETIPFNKDPITDTFDVLQTYIDECKANGISLVVVIPVMSSSLASDKTQWLDVTNTGEQGEVFYSPANKEYRQAFMDYISFILGNYDIDGLQLDYIRYIGYFGSGTESGYDDDTIALFEEKTGYGADVVEEIGKMQEKHKYWKLWRNFKVELINSWVEECYGIVKQLRPDVFVSAAVAESMSKDAYSQDYKAWIKGGYIDGIYPMTYSQGVNQFTIENFNSDMSDKTYLVMGSGAYLGRDFEWITDENLSTSVCGAEGIAYFEWTAVRDQGYVQLLGNQLFEDDAIPVTGDYNIVVEKLIEASEKRIELYKGDNSESVASLVPNKTANLNQIENALQEMEKLVSKEDAKWLLSDLRLAKKVLLINGFTFDESENDVSEEANSVDTVSDEMTSGEVSGTEQNPQQNGKMYAIIAVVATLVIAVVTTLFVKKKKK